MTGRITFWRTTGCTVAILLLLNGVAYSSVVERPMDELSRHRQSAELDSPPLMNGETNEESSAKEGNQPTLPNGVDAFKEGFGDWAVECRIVGAARTCSMGQHQRDTKTGQVVIAMAVSPTENGSTKIVILMPFGLALAQGIQLKLDNWSAAQTAQFATCIADGCLVPIDFSDSSMDALKQAKTLTITATLSSSGTRPVFNIPLKGFAAAYARLMSLK